MASEMIPACSLACVQWNDLSRTLATDKQCNDNGLVFRRLPGLTDKRIEIAIRGCDAAQGNGWALFFRGAAANGGVCFKRTQLKGKAVP